MTVIQSTPRAIVNWNSFSVGRPNSVTFQQPGSSSAILNRVTGSTPSTIAGQINANGQVVLVNPNGIAITSTGTVNVGGGFVASTLGISDDDFNQGRYKFAGKGASAAVSNQGAITVGRGGYAALIGGTVDNAGKIAVPVGKIGLASGERVTLDVAGDGFLQIAGPTASSAGGKALIEQRGSLSANGGQIVVAAATVHEAARNAVNLGGVVEARTIGGRTGAISISGGDGGSVAMTGTVDAGGGRRAASGNAGSIAVTGRNIEVAKSATLNASGTGPAGSGGKITVIADKTAGSLKFDGTAKATGGAKTGTGGFVETSGATVDFKNSTIDTSASPGRTGTWLVDPFDLKIDSSAAAAVSTALASNNVTLQTGNLNTSSNAGAGSVSPSAFGTTSSGDGDIIISSGIAWTSGNTLTLDAYRSIEVKATIAAGNNGKVVLITGNQTGNGTSTSATGDYSFGATKEGGVGNITFGSTPGTAALNIATGGGNAAPVAYTLIYDTGTGPNGLRSLNGSSGRFALANALSATPLGTVNNQVNSTFAGTFTGLGNAINDLKININGDNSGLFGSLTGTVRDLGIINVNMNGSASTRSGPLAGLIEIGGIVKNSWSTGRVTGGTNAGGLVGQVKGLLTDSYSTVTVVGGMGAGGLAGSIAGGTISTSHATGAVSGGTAGITGGLVGEMTGPGGSIIDSDASGAVKANWGKVGGLVGLIAGGTASSPNTIKNSNASGSVTGNGPGGTGGLVGGASGTTILTDTSASGRVESAAASEFYNAADIGGLIGYGSSTSINRSHATGEVFTATGGVPNVGGLAGKLENDSAVNVSYATGNVTGGRSTGGLVGTLGDNSSIADAYAQGTVTGTVQVGGLVGTANSSMTNVYASGRVSPRNDHSTEIGGLVGRTNDITVTNGYWDWTPAGTNQFYGYGGGTRTLKGGGRQTTTQLQSGRMPAGFNTPITANNNPWKTVVDVYPFFGAVAERSKPVDVTVPPSTDQSKRTAVAAQTLSWINTSLNVDIWMLDNISFMAEPVSQASSPCLEWYGERDVLEGGCIETTTAGLTPNYGATVLCVDRPCLLAGLVSDDPALAKATKQRMDNKASRFQPSAKPELANR